MLGEINSLIKSSVPLSGAENGVEAGSAHLVSFRESHALKNAGSVRAGSSSVLLQNVIAD